MKHIEKIRSFETVVFTVLSLILAAVAIHYFNKCMGWDYEQWSISSIVCVFAGISILFGSFFCQLYDRT